MSSSSSSLLVDKILTSILPTSWSEPRNGTMTCPCGAVQFDIHVPPSSYAIVEQTNAICHCTDCVGFAEACPNGQHVIRNHGTHLVNFYKSDLTLVKGQDEIRAVQLYAGSPMVRTYCGKCGTPLGADIMAAPITLLYEPLIRDTYPIVFLPTLVLGFREAVAGTKRYVRTAIVRSRNFGVIFLVKVIQRVLLGFVLGKMEGGLLNNKYDGIPIGLDTIVATDTVSSKSKDQ